MDETRTDRVKHRGTGATGTVTARYERTGPYLGDLAGEWADVQFDDGLFCSVPASELVLGNEPAGRQLEPARLGSPTPALTSRVSGVSRRRVNPPRPVGPCPCECNHGGFCGGCGHAGCGGRR